MLKVLEQAAFAAEQKNWSLLSECLQKLPVKKNSASEYSATPEIEQLLSLAIEILETGDFYQRWEAAKIFPRLGSVAIAPLVKILADEDEEDRELRWFAARILGDFHHSAAISALVDVLKTSNNEDLTAMAAAALASLGAGAKNATAFKAAIAALTDLLARDDTRALAVKALAHIRHSETIAPLLSVVRDREVAVRTTAIEALSSFHDDRIAPVLVDALKDTAASVRRQATIGLGLRAELQEQLELVEQLKLQLVDFNQEVCSAAAIALGRMKNDSAADVLFEALLSTYTPVALKVQIVRSLSWIETPKALSYLQQAIAARNVAILSRGDLEQGSRGDLEQGSRGDLEIKSRGELPMPNTPTEIDIVCLEIIAVLGRVEQRDLVPMAVEILLDALNSNYPAMQHARLKQALTTSLGQLKDPVAVEALIQMLADPDEGVKWHAIAALKKFKGVAAKLEALAASENLTPALLQGIAIALENFRLKNCAKID